MGWNLKVWTRKALRKKEKGKRGIRKQKETNKRNFRQLTKRKEKATTIRNWKQEEVWLIITTNY